jgi:hypothetical protein
MTDLRFILALAIAIVDCRAGDAGFEYRLAELPYWHETLPCEEKISLLTYAGKPVRACKQPLLELRPEEIEQATVYEKGDVEDPSKRFYLLLLRPDAEAAARFLAEARLRPVGPFIVSYRSYIASAAFPSRWEDAVEGGVYSSADEAAGIARELGIEPTMEPFDPKLFEEERAAWWQAIELDRTGEPPPQRRGPP